jgi:MBG domain (YGX type)
MGTLAAANYDFVNLLSGVLTVTPAPLTISVNNATRQQGQPNPSFTFTYHGFVNGDGPASLTTPAVASTAANISSSPGVYPITVSGASSASYTMTYVSGSLTVTAPPLVTMTSVQDILNKKHKVTAVIITFSGAVNATESRLDQDLSIGHAR